ncbi:MAG: hypothetical protein ACE37H_08905 [Phycisphaeraceae bacterium]
MSFENYCWWHLILTCRGQWLPGDPRGFRAKGHRIHSSGDCKQRPPEGEHQGLHAYHRQQKCDTIEVPDSYRAVVGQAILNKAIAMNAPCLVIAVGRAHTHLVAAMLNDWQHVKRETGRLKQAGSHAIREVLPGRVWADGGKPIRIQDQKHQSSVFRYICDHEKDGAWVWRDGVVESGGDPGLRPAQGRLLSEFLEYRG